MAGLTGKVAIATGAGRGIGQAIARGFAEAGAAVCCVARTWDEIGATAGAIVEAGRRSHCPVAAGLQSAFGCTACGGR